MVEGGWALHRKNIFLSQNDDFGCILPQFLTGRKHRVTRSLGMQILRFNRETKFTKTVQKLSKIHRQTKGGRSHHRLLNTPLVLTTCKIENTRSKSSTCLQKYDNARCLTCATSCWTAESTESRTRRKPLRAQALPGRKFPWTKVLPVRKSVLHTTQRQNDYH